MWIPLSFCTQKLRRYVLPTFIQFRDQNILLFSLLTTQTSDQTFNCRIKSAFEGFLRGFDERLLRILFMVFFYTYRARGLYLLRE